ncbi:hypothetical protein GALMADRAFT_139816 [Galerina marginata CBS 339.88]|uniref:Uncharacterized protein n=1 Tax=Galerina marginata (strain CBS 339.88) TaxID=685588 RepID=A0A067SYQ1_GALM3|nr:hypothetical protein GALMADRAFT_139816 [Galerina marginata CBS 339.88]
MSAGDEGDPSSRVACRPTSSCDAVPNGLGFAVGAVTELTVLALWYGWAAAEPQITRGRSGGRHCEGLVKQKLERRDEQCVRSISSLRNVQLEREHQHDWVAAMVARILYEP